MVNMSRRVLFQYLNTQVRLIVATAMLGGLSTPACTTFLLAGSDHVLFCNNEDSKYSHTRVWFVPAANGRLGCVYVGLWNEWAQGGMNSKGVAFDGVAGISLDGVTNAVPVAIQSKMVKVRGNPSERMLESCGSVDEAVSFYQSHGEPTFSYATIVVADRTGAIAVIGNKAGRLHFSKGAGPAAWGWNGGLAAELIAQDSTPVIPNAAAILDAARSRDEYATKYSNVFDLTTGDIVLFDFSRGSSGITFRLAEELGKGRHHFRMHLLWQQAARKVKGP